MKVRTIAVILAALSGCGRDENSICTPSPSTAEIGGQWAACVHTWAYRLAKSPDPAPIVATVVEEKCSIALTRDVARLSDPSERTVVESALKNRSQKEALVRVEEARAGNCSAS